ncbi:MAG: hypothetical protein GF383_05360 [Candidatus Lokiarchaeota archaeon]|nr:hypothetical protein [Candidatus Lokiarchaeota archaeon]MBD3339324.1 hypothetical protein [Candidatus Lokiarchaeota archaeon]
MTSQLGKDILHIGFKRSLEIETYVKEYLVNGRAIEGIITNNRNEKEVYLNDRGYLKQIVKGFETIYGEKCRGYIVKGYENFKRRFMSDGYLYLVVDKDKEQFIMVGFVKIIGKRKNNTFDSLWHGDYTAEASNALKNPNYAGRINSRKFIDLRQKLTQIAYKYVIAGFQGWGTGRVYWSTQVLLRNLVENLVYGYFLYHVPWMAIWGDLCYNTHSVVMCKSPKRKKITVKTKISSKFQDLSWAKGVRKYLRGHEGSEEDGFTIEPIIHNIKDDKTEAVLKLVSANDVESVNNALGEGFRISAILPSRIYERGKFRSLIQLQKITHYESFPVEPPSPEVWRKHIPEWPPKLTEATWKFIKRFKVVDSFPKCTRERFLYAL